MLPVLVGPLSAFQPFSYPWTLTSPGHWAILGNWRSGLPGETILLPVLWAANIRRPSISNSNGHRPLRVPIHTYIFIIFYGYSNGVPSINRDGGEVGEPLTLPVGGNGRLYGIAAVGEFCPRGNHNFIIEYTLQVLFMST